MGFRVLEFRVRFCSHCGWPTCRLCTWALTSHCRIPKFGPSPFPAPSKRTVHVLSSCHFELSYFFPSLPTAAPPPYRNRAAHPRAYDSASPAQLPSLQHTTPQQLEPSLVSAVRSASNCVPKRSPSPQTLFEKRPSHCRRYAKRPSAMPPSGTSSPHLRSVASKDTRAPLANPRPSTSNPPPRLPSNSSIADQ